MTSSSPTNQSNDNVGAALAALRGLSGLLNNPILQLSGLQQAFQSPTALQQLQQIAMLQSHSQPAPFFLPNQVSHKVISFVLFFS